MMRSPVADCLCIVAVDAAKYVNAALIFNIYSDILRGPFEFDGSQTGFQTLRTEIKQTREAYELTTVLLGFETTAHYCEDLVRVSDEVGSVVCVINAATTAEEDAELYQDRTGLSACDRAVYPARALSDKLKESREARTASNPHPGQTSIGGGTDHVCQSDPYKYGSNFSCIPRHKNLEGWEEPSGESLFRVHV